MNADQAKFLAQVVGQQLQQEWMTTYKTISAIPEGKKDYKPEPNSRTAWEIAHHMAIADVGFLDAVAAADFKQFPAKCDAKTVSDLSDWYKHQMPKALEKVLAVDGSQLMQIIDNWGMKLPWVSYLMFCNNHMVHHRGQLAAYIRPMGGKVPSIYGGSFDEKFGG